MAFSVVAHYLIEKSLRKIILVLAPRPRQSRPLAKQTDCLFLFLSPKNHMQTERQRILKEFNEMKGLLDSKEKRVLQKLEEDKVNVLDNLVVARDQLDWQRQYLRGLISHIEHQIWGSSEDMLQVRLRLERLYDEI